MKIKYCKGYKYQLREDFSVYTPIMPEHDIVVPLVSLTTTGLLTIQKYFAWDGCSGPTWDDRTNMRACLIHDALYYLMRIGALPVTWRPAVDLLLADVMTQDGALLIRASYYELAVRLCAEDNAMPCNARKVLVAP